MTKALIIIDMIQAYTRDIKADTHLVRNQLILIRQFQKRKLPVIAAVPETISKAGRKNPIMLHLWGDELKGDDARAKGHKRRDLIPELSGIAWSKTVRKPEYSAFYKTDLAAYCRKKKITELYLCGIYSGVCVHYTAVDAAYRRIWPILVTDASTTSDPKMHKANCRRFAQAVGKTITTAQLAKSLK